MTNFCSSFYFVQHKVLFLTTHFLFVTSLKIKACNITQVKRVHLIVKQPLQFVAQPGPVVKLLNKSNTVLAKTIKLIGLVVHILQQIISANNYLNIFSCKMQWKPHGSGSKVWKLGNIPKVIFLDFLFIRS